MFIAIYQHTGPSALPSSTIVYPGDCFLVVPGKGLVHIWNDAALIALAPVENGLPLKRVTLNPTQFRVLWQLVTPRNDDGVKQPI